MCIAIFIIFSLSYIDYEITDCQTTITYFGNGAITQNEGQYAKGKKKIIICEGITEISSYAFSQTTYPTSALDSFLYEEVELPRSLYSIGSYAFQNYYSYLKKIHFVDYPYGTSSSSTFENELESFYSLRYIVFIKTMELFAIIFLQLFLHLNQTHFHHVQSKIYN